MEYDYWKQIKGYPHLFVSRDGRVWTTTYNRELKPQLTNRGYLKIGLNKDKVIKNVGVHRLVAEAFIPNPDNLPAVDHIDGNKLNNKVENLQWISNSDNTRKACIGKDRRPKPIVCIETGKVYKNIKEANRDLSIPEAVLSAVVRGEYHSYHGLHFAYVKYSERETIEGYLSPKGYAEKHGLNLTTVRRHIINGTLPHTQLGAGNNAAILIKENEPWVELNRGRKPKQ